MDEEERKFWDACYAAVLSNPNEWTNPGTSVTEKAGLVADASLEERRRRFPRNQTPYRG